MKKRGECLRPLTVAAVSILTFGLAASGAQQRQVQPPLRHDAAAVIKLVPVRVLDAEGRPVRGLTKNDFVLRDNDELKTITEFEVYESTKTRGVAEEDARPEAKRRFFFVLDMQSSDLFGNRDSKNAVLEFAENQIRGGDKACVMTFGALTGLVLRQYLTSDLDKIRKAIRRSIEMGGGGTSLLSSATTDVVDKRREVNFMDLPPTSRYAPPNEAGKTESVPLPVIREIGSTPFAGSEIQLDMDTAGGGAYVRAARTKADFDVSMKELAQAMRFIPGAKSVVYFSTRIPGQDVSRHFAEANATIFAVNTNLAAGPSRMKELKEKQGEILKGFAEATGGHYFADVKDAKTIAQDVEMLSGNYYVLGYYINPAWDGRLHQIKVEVGRPSLRVLAQAAYNDPKPFTALSDLEKNLQLFDLALSDKPVTTDALELPAEILFGSSIKEANAALLLKLAVEVKTGLPPGKTEIYAFIFDKERKVRLAERGEMDTSPHARKTLYPYLLTALQPGEYELRVMARDMGSGQAAVSRFPFAVPPRSSERAALFSPLLLVPGSKPDFVRMSRQAKSEKEPLSIIRFYPFLPTNSVPLVNDLPPDADKVWALVPLDPGTGAPAERDLSVRMVPAAGGEEVPIDWGLIDTKKSEAGKEFLLVGIVFPDLKPGVYKLGFSLKDAKTGETLAAEASFTKK